MGDGGGRGLSLGLCLHLEWLEGGEDGGTGEEGEDFEGTFCISGKEPLCHAGLCVLPVIEFPVYGLATYQSGMSSLSRDSLTLSLSASCPRVFSGTCK